MIKLFTIGFTKKSAEQFFELLRKNNVQRLVDVRINNSSQLAGFAKGKDLEYFVKKICGIKYVHIKEFAPTKDLLTRWHDQKISWKGYVGEYISLLTTRKINQKYKADQFNGACFLCSEETPELCHRRLLAEYLKDNYCGTEDISIIHLK